MNWLANPMQALEKFIEMSTALSCERDLDKLLAGMLDSARRLTSADAGWFYLLDNTKKFLVVSECQCDSQDMRREDFPQVSLYTGGHQNLDDLAAYCAFTGNIVNVANVRSMLGINSQHVYKLMERIRYRVHSILAMPMRNHENLILGVLFLVNRKESDNGKQAPFPADIEGMVQAISSQAGIALENARLLKKNQQLIDILDQANRKLTEENKLLRSRIQGEFDFSRIIGRSTAMAQVLDLLSRVLESDATVLIRGETGTGKELIANAVHFNSPRRGARFVAQNCAALPENLLESELFGYKKGAFSGAHTDKIGLIELADSGTLFLDEIGDMPLALQAKLLRVLQEKEVRPLGALEGRKVNVRVVAATHCNLEQKITDGAFRQDLYYRLSVFPIDVPPLRNRKEDIPALLRHFLDNLSKLYEKDIATIAPKALDLLTQYDYPGNIRELRNIVERAVLLAVAKGSILPEHLPEQIQQLQSRNTTALASRHFAADKSSLKDVLEEFEADAIRQALAGFNWNQTKTAAALGIGRRTLISKMNRYRIDRDGKSE